MKNIRQIAFVAIMAGITFASQLLLAGIPNIELVSVILLISALSLRLPTSLTIGFVFVILQGLYWGFADWVIAYLYVWPFFILMGFLLKSWLITPLRTAFFSGIFGLLFGTLFSLQHLVLFGPYAAISYIISGIAFDIVHAIGNFILMLVLFEPLSRVIILVKSKIGGV